MKRWNRFGLCAAALLCLAACATSTAFRSTYRHAGAHALDPSSKMAVVYMSRDENARRAAESEMVQKLGQHGIQAVASNTLIPADEVGQAANMQRVFTGHAIDSVLILRVLDEGETLDVGPPPYDRFPPDLHYLRLSRYWGWGWGLVLSPGYLRTDTVVSMESLVYALKDDDLLWGSRSHQVARADAPSLVGAVADAIPEDMSSQGLLARR
jgi:hypothetical protein